MRKKINNKMTDGKTVLVTGCTSGLGEALARELASRGFIVYAGARSLDKLKIKGETIRPVKLDITDDKQCQTAIRKIIKEEGKIYALINNAGYTITGSTVDFSPKQYLDILNTNAVGAFRLTKLVFPYMKAHGYGRIINITSLNGLVSLPGFSLYSSSKFALEALGLALRYEFCRDGVWVTNVAPGAIERISEGDDKKLPHRAAREKFLLLKLIMPMISQEKVVNKILGVLEETSLPSRVILGADAKIIYFLYRFLPGKIWDWLIRFVWNKK